MVVCLNPPLSSTGLFSRTTMTTSIPEHISVQTLLPHLERRGPASVGQTKGLNLPCDTAFPLGSHKRRGRQPWASLS